MSLTADRLVGPRDRERERAVRGRRTGAVPILRLGPATDWVYCEGAPASDPNRSLRGIRPEASWNRRLVAAYRGKEKYVLDVGNGRITRWTFGGDPDEASGRTVEGRDAAQLRSEVFGDYESFGGTVLAVTSSAGESEVDRRLKSWGYD